MDEDNQELTDEGEEEETLEPFVDYINLDPEITEQAEDLYNLYKVELIGQPQIVETDKEKVTRAIQKVYRENKKKSSKKTMDNADVPAPKISKPQVLPNNAVEAEPEIVGADPPEVEVKIFDLDDIEEEDETKIEPSRNNADTDVFSITELRPRESQDASRLLLRTSSSLTFRRSKENIKVEPGNQGPIPKLDEDPSKRGSKKITTIVSNPDEQNKNNLEGVSKKQLNSKSSQTGWTGTCGSKKNSSTQETPQTRKNSSNRPNKGCFPKEYYTDFPGEIVPVQEIVDFYRTLIDTLGCENLPCNNCDREENMGLEEESLVGFITDLVGGLLETAVEKWRTMNKNKNRVSDPTLPEFADAPTMTNEQILPEASPPISDQFLIASDLLPFSVDSTTQDVGTEGFPPPEGN